MAQGAARIRRAEGRAAAPGGTEPSLREKLRAHWDTRDRILAPPPETANRLGVAYVLVFSTSLMYSVLWLLLPHLEAEAAAGRGGVWVRLPPLVQCSVVWWLYLELMLNWGLCCLKDLSRVTPTRVRRALAGLQQARGGGWPEGLSGGSEHSGGECRGCCVPRGCEGEEGSGGEGLREELEGRGWRQCLSCQLLAPPRSYHCKVCSMCVLKRDHHCYFTACCVGLHNQRYFIVFLLYVALGTGLHALLTAAALPSLLTPSGGRLALLPPPLVVALWVGGVLGGQDALLGVQLWLCALTCVGAAAFLAWQCVLVHRAQTAHELAHGVTRYRRERGGLGARLTEVFGLYWAGNLLFPLRTLPPGDGFVWDSCEELHGKGL